MAYFSMTAFNPKSAVARRVYETDDLLDTTIPLALIVKVQDGGEVSIHANRAELEIIYSALDKFFDEVHKAEREERDRELYAEALYDMSLEA